MSTTRMEALSDGVIAIAATLLVIELAVPPAGEDVWHAVAEELPSIAAFAVSFLTILILWVNHHALFSAVHRVDRGLLFLNGLLLLGISFVSYPTAVLGRALQGEGTYDRSAAVFYCLVLAGVSAVFAGLWAYLGAHRDLLRPADQARPPAALRRSLVGPTLYLLAAGVGLISAPLALAMAAATAAYFALPPRSRARTGVKP